MKVCKIILLSVLSLIFACSSFGCGKKGEAVTVNVLLPDGAPALALAGIFYGGEEEKAENALNCKDAILPGYDVRFALGQESAIATSVAAGRADIAIMPTNSAAVLYNKGTDVKLALVNVHGLLYMVGKTSLSSLDALKGKVVYSIGEGGTPDYIFKYLLTKNGIAYEKSDVPEEGKVAITYVEGGSALIPLLKQGKAEYGILGEPAVTNACEKAGVSVVMDLQRAMGGATAVPQASLVISGKLLREHPDFVKAFVKKVKEGNDWLPEHLTEAAQAVARLGSTALSSGKISAETFDRCNIFAQDAKDAKENVKEYLTVLMDFNPAAVGGKLPDEGFWYNE